MGISKIIVRAIWDDDAEVWVATTDDVPGLATEAATIEDLRAKIVVMIPELMVANGVKAEGADLTIQIVAEQSTRIASPQAA
jgi:hypothetical protein